MVNKSNPTGEHLIQLISESTGLPTQLVERELERLLEKAGKSKSTTNLDDLREILSDYVQEVLVEAKDNHKPHNEPSAR